MTTVNSYFLKIRSVFTYLLKRAQDVAKTAGNRKVPPDIASLSLPL